MKPQNVLILPGWENSGPRHWQSLWEQRHEERYRASPLLRRMVHEGRTGRAAGEGFFSY